MKLLQIDFRRFFFAFILVLGLHVHVQAATTPVYALTSISNPSNGGTVSRNSSANSYPSGTRVTLMATPAPGYTFAGWSGGCGGTGACMVAMMGNTTVTANFAPVSYTLTVSPYPSNGGTVSRNPSANSYPGGARVALTATPVAGNTFTGWSGGCNGTSTSCTVTMASNTTVTANFASIPSVSGVTASNAAQGQDTTFTVVGANMTNTTAWYVANCGSGTISGGSATSKTFTCKPSIAGSLNGEIKDSSGGKNLKSFTVIVTTPAPTVSGVTASGAVQNKATTFTVSGINLTDGMVGRQLRLRHFEWWRRDEQNILLHTNKNGGDKWNYQG